MQAAKSLSAPEASDGFIIVFETSSFAPPRWEAPVLTEELEQLLADRVLHYVGTTDGAFTAVVASASEPTFDIPVEGDAAESEAPEPGSNAGNAPQRGGPPRDQGEDAVPESSANAGVPVEETPAVTREVTLPKFKYPTELRLLAPGILSTTLSSDRLWAYDVRQPTYDRFEAQLAAAVGDISALQLAGSDEDARLWILDNATCSARCPASCCSNRGQTRVFACDRALRRSAGCPDLLLTAGCLAFVDGFQQLIELRGCEASTSRRRMTSREVRTGRFERQRTQPRQ